jgi:3-hydroxyisobutyrate dehydrogenase-like beta-hydroxyacid dehydrogenase
MSNLAEPQAVALIGVGAMGGALAERVLRGGFRTVLVDARAEALEPYGGRVEVAGSPRDAAERADIVIACLATPSSYDEVVRGPNGIAASRRRSIYVHAGTSSASLVRELAATLATSGIATVDAPVTGGVDRARAGDLTVIASGPAGAFEAASPVLRSYGSKIIYFGETVGAAQTMKVVNNMLNFANLALASEILVVGARAGLDADLMLDVINSGSGQNSATLIKFPRHILTGTFDYKGWLSHAIKDGRLFLDQAADLTVPVPLSAAMHNTFVTAFAMGDGRPDYDITEVIRHMERAAGVEVRRKQG